MRKDPRERTRSCRTSEKWSIKKLTTRNNSFHPGHTGPLCNPPTWTAQLSNQAFVICLGLRFKFPALGEFTLTSGCIQGCVLIHSAVFHRTLAWLRVVTPRVRFFSLWFPNWRRGCHFYALIRATWKSDHLQMWNNYCKGSTFLSYLKTPVRPGFEPVTSRSAAWCPTNTANETAVSFESKTRAKFSYDFTGVNLILLILESSTWNVSWLSARKTMGNNCRYHVLQAY